MNRIKYIIPALLLAVLLNGCKTTTHTVKRGAFIPEGDAIRLQMTMNDLEIAGETEITVSYYRYLGIFTVINEVNGVGYNPYNLNKTRINGVSFGASSKLCKATDKIIEEIPDASWYHVVYNKKKDEPLIFGKVISETALIRAYNIKYAKEDAKQNTEPQTVQSATVPQSEQPRSLTVTGTITDGKEQLRGVSITVKGTTIFTVTGVDGKYAIDIPIDDARLVFSLVGFETKEVAVGRNSVVDAALTPSRSSRRRQ
jgi:hypothetical protein